MSIQKPHALTLLGVGGFAALLGGFGVAYNDYQHRPEPNPTITVAEATKEKEALALQHSLTEAKLNTSLQASTAYGSAERDKRLAVCKKLVAYRIVLPECK